MRPAASISPQPLSSTVARSYSATIRIGVRLWSTTNMPPPRSVTKVKSPSLVVRGQIGALSGRSSGSWQGAPLGVVQVARSIAASSSSVKRSWR